MAGEAFSAGAALEPAPLLAERIRRGAAAAVAQGRVWLAAIAVVALAARLYLAWRSTETLVARLTPDDTYYYLQVARNIAHGHGATLDGVSLTNGFHPLWLALLIPFAHLGREAFLHTALTIGALLGTGSILVFWWAVSPLSRRPVIRVAATSFYAFNPAMLYSAVNGLETSLSLLTLVTLLGMYLRARGRDVVDYRYWLLFGAVAGLAVLARTDNGLFVLGMLAALVPLCRWNPRPALLAGVASLAVTSPWFLWSIAVFGSPVQGSAQAISLLYQTNFDPFGVRPFTDVVKHSLSFLKQAYLVTLPESTFFNRPTLGVLTGGLIFTSSLAAARSISARRLLWSRGPMLAAPAAAFLTIVAIHAGVRWFVQIWYLAPAVPIAGLFLALGLEATSDWLEDEARSDGRLRYAVIPFLLVVLFATLWAHAEQTRNRSRDLWPWQRDMYHAALWLRDHTQKDARVGSMNAGIVAYFSGRQTINLDGVVNNDALEATKKHQLLAYMDEVRPDYLADYDIYVNGFGILYGGDIGPRLQLEAQFGSHAIYPFRIYRFHPP